MDGAALGERFSTAVVLFHEAIGQRLGLSAGDHKALGQIQRHGPVAAGTLAELLGLTPGAVTALLDRLERKGLAMRSPDPSDRRRSLIEARDAPDLSSVFVELQRESAHFAERFSEDEWTVIVDYLAGMTEILQGQTRRLSRDAPADHLVDPERRER